MFITNDKFISFARIRYVQRLGIVVARGDDGVEREWWGYSVHTDYDVEERMLFDTEESCEKDLMELLAAMEEAGY